jgi:hypothetical protein
MEPSELDALAWALYKDRRFAQAAICASEALKLLPDDPEILYHSALIAYALDKKELARSYAARSLQLSWARETGRRAGNAKAA